MGVWLGVGVGVSVCGCGCLSLCVGVGVGVSVCVSVCGCACLSLCVWVWVCVHHVLLRRSCLIIHHIQMERERQRRRQARKATESQVENGGNSDELGRIKGLKKPSGAGEFDDLIMALRSGDVFGVSEVPRNKGPKQGAKAKQGKLKNVKAGVGSGKERESGGRTAYL